jgi:16S rRNA processing protein RimM
MNHGADDLLEVTVPGASDTALIPFTKAIVPTVELAARRMVIDPPEGLL